MSEPLQITSVKIVKENLIQIEFSHDAILLQPKDIQIYGDFIIKKIRKEANRLFLFTSQLDFRKNYYIAIKDKIKKPVDPGALLDQIYSDKSLGYSIEGDQMVFRLFAPRANRVKLILFENHSDTEGQEYEMQSDKDGVWEIALPGPLGGKYYGYKVAGPQDPTELFQPDKTIADPYSRAVCTKNTFLHEAKSIIIKTDDYDWEGDTPLNYGWKDLIIYEMHVRDMTAHPSALAKEKGTYHGLLEPQTRGGLNHIKELGVNAVELLPCQEFANIEIPYQVEVNGEVNTWNPYSQNHWGYMTSYFFAPESYYASGGNLKTGEFSGIEGNQVREFKDMVKEFHRAGIAVIMDVVYNHVSHYDLNPLKLIDKKYYFRLDSDLNFTNLSGCGNDFKTERPMARRLILDSIKFWLEEYHIDGFRFDLATMIDWETIEQIIEMAKKINPHVILIAEPWGGGKYDLAGFSERGWAAWNDLFRNGVKGENPFNGLGWIFGHLWGGNHFDTITNFVKGTLRSQGGPFILPEHSVNYLESHDGYTLGDFIRLGAGEVKPDERITDLTKHITLTPRQLQLHKLAATFLLTSQGMVMIGEGQEFARSKVIAPTNAPDPDVGKLDHNSYNKDNETNWLNYEHIEINRELFDFYQKLIALRKQHPAFRRTPPEKIQFLKSDSEFSLGFWLAKEYSKDSKSFVVLLNANPEKQVTFSLPEGTWRKVVDSHRAELYEFGNPLKQQAVLPPASVMILTQ